MNRIRTWLVRTIFGQAKSEAPGDGLMRADHPGRSRPDLDAEAIGSAASYEILCPCGAIIPVTFTCHIEDRDDGTQELIATPDATDLWVHSFTHEQEKS